MKKGGSLRTDRYGFGTQHFRDEPIKWDFAGGVLPPPLTKGATYQSLRPLWKPPKFAPRQERGECELTHSFQALGSL